MRRIQVIAGPLVPLLIWSILWWALGKPQLILAGTVFTAFLIAIGVVRARLDTPEWDGIRNLCTAGGLVLALCCSVLAVTWDSDDHVANPLAGELDPLAYDDFEVVGRIVSWDVLPAASPLEYEDWEPLLVTVADGPESFEFICDGRDLRDRLERGRTIKATGEYEGRYSTSTTPVASWVAILD